MNNRYKEICDYIDKKLGIIDSINDREFQSSCLFTLLDCFAQEYSNYQPNNKKAFCYFLTTFGGDYVDTLNRIDPITLYYSCEKLKHNCNLNNLIESFEYAPSQMQTECSKILEECEKCRDKCKPNRKQTDRYIELLYKYRSKLVHEMSAPASIFQTMHNHEYILYYQMSELIDMDDSWWNLVFPYKYIKNLFRQAIMSYLEHCKVKSLDPFQNNVKRQRDFITWEY